MWGSGLRRAGLPFDDVDEFADCEASWHLFLHAHHGGLSAGYCFSGFSLFSMVRSLPFACSLDSLNDEMNHIIACPRKQKSDYGDRKRIERNKEEADGCR